MMLLRSFRISLRALTRNKLRTGLAILGMTIGVAAVLTMFALGTGAQQTVTEDVRHAGTTLIDVKSGNYTRGGEESNIPTGLGAANTLTSDDAQAIAGISGVQSVASQVTLLGWTRTSTEKDYTHIIGTDVTLAPMNNWTFPRGKFFTPEDVTSSAHAAVIGPNVAGHLFGDENPIGREVEIHNAAYRVVGVITTNNVDQEDMVFIPYTTLQKALGIQYLQSITVSVEQAGDATLVGNQIQKMLRQRHHLNDATGANHPSGIIAANQMPSMGSASGLPDDFTVQTQAAEALTKGLYTSVAAFVLANMSNLDQANMQAMVGTLDRAGKTMTALLAAIATISLIVGGIGIMNIMLVSVTERTQEIGIRRAVGARTRDVLQQFLVEAITLSLCGGAVGIAVGFVAALVIARVLEWPASISVVAVALAFGIAAAVGVFFGFYPAHRASKLSPIDALRYE
jgi:putative ABC transport system permease protein